MIGYRAWKIQVGTQDFMLEAKIKQLLLRPFNYREQNKILTLYIKYMNRKHFAKMLNFSYGTTKKQNRFFSIHFQCFQNEFSLSLVLQRNGFLSNCFIFVHAFDGVQKNQNTGSRVKNLIGIKCTVRAVTNRDDAIGIHIVQQLDKRLFLSTTSISFSIN